MAKSNPKPWQRGYIPTNKPSPAKWVQEWKVGKGAQLHQAFERYCKDDVDHAADAMPFTGSVGVMEDVCVKK